MATISPASLEEICQSFICANIEDLCQQDANDIVDMCGFSFHKLTFISEMFLHEQLAENLMKTLSHNGKLTTRTASLFINPKTCRIRKFYLGKCKVGGAILKLLFWNHTVVKLDLHGTTCTMLPSSSLFELLNGMSSTIRELNLSHTSFVLDFSAVWPLKCLTHLDISNTQVSDNAMIVASQYLECLESINVSNTYISETASFGNLRSRLKTLLAYNTLLTWANPAEFRNFGCLQKLDISRNPDNKLGDALYDNAKMLFIADSQILPMLVYLDISGTPKMGNIMEGDLLQTFLSCHPNLRFLGLAGLTHPITEILPSYIEVTGEANEQQILSSLRAYPNRAAYMTRALHGLFHITKNWTERKPEVLKLVLPPLEKHPKDLRVQMAATACVFNIIREGTENDVHPTYLSKIASLVLSAMSVFPDKHNLLRNCLLILESRQILRKATFDNFEASSRAMDALCLFSSDQDISRLAIKLCAILSSKISTQETLALGTETNIMTLFNVTKEKIATNQVDYTFSVALSVLWNLTDEAPSTCLLFVQKGGLEMMAQGLKVFNEVAQEKNVVIIKKKILGTLNNIAEVPSLRQDLITDEFMDIFGSLLADAPIELSYFCGGILSNVMLEWSDDKPLHFCTKQQMLHKLEQAVTSWEFPAEELVAYRSFSPFVPLLHCSMPAVQMWALWGMYHVCSRNGPRYIPLLIDGGITESVHRIIKTSFYGVSELAKKLINTVTSFQLPGK